VAASECFTRFIFSKSHFAREKGRVKAQALLPIFNQESQRWETSTHRIDGLGPQQIWELGYRHVENAQESRTIKARASGRYAAATSRGLTLDVNGDPFPRHVDIVGWSADKSDRMMKATEIADELALELEPRPSSS
jgi:hypothetical protein